MKCQRTTCVVLGLVAVLLTLNLVRGEATAQPRDNLVDAAPPPPTVVGIGVDKNANTTLAATRLVRVWSDGRVDATWFLFGTGSGDQNCAVLDVCGPTVLIEP